MQVISFFSAKGGTGKTTFNMLLASYLKYELGKRVMLMDFDGPEYSLSFCRRRELEYLKSQGAEVDERAFYPIVTVRDHSPEKLDALARKIPTMREAFDYIIMDFKGSLNKADPVSIMATAGVLDKVIIPVELDPMIIASMKSLATVFKANGQDAILFFNKVHGKEKPEQYDAIRQWFIEKGCTVAKNQVRVTIGMKREQNGSESFLRSTISFQDKTIRKMNPGIIGLFNELIDYG